MRNDTSNVILKVFDWAIGISALMMLLKAVGYFLTESAVIFADMSQSMVHIGALSFTAFALRYGSQPSSRSRRNIDASFTLFAKGFQGALIVFAGAATIAVAIAKFLASEDLNHIELGTILVVISTFINALLGFYLISFARLRRDLNIESNAKLILLSSAISLGVIASLLGHANYGVQWVDQLVSIALGIYTLLLGISLLRQSVDKLIDKGDPLITRQLTEILSARCAANNIHFTDLKHIKTGDQHWVNVTLQFPPQTEIGEAHQIASDVEISIISALSNRAHIVITMEAQKK